MYYWNKWRGTAAGIQHLHSALPDMDLRLIDSRCRNRRIFEVHNHKLHLKCSKKGEISCSNAPKSQWSPPGGDRRQLALTPPSAFQHQAKLEQPKEAETILLLAGIQFANILIVVISAVAPEVSFLVNKTTLKHSSRSVYGAVEHFLLLQGEPLSLVASFPRIDDPGVDFLQRCWYSCVSSLHLSQMFSQRPAPGSPSALTSTLKSCSSFLFL